PSSSTEFSRIQLRSRRGNPSCAESAIRATLCLSSAGHAGTPRREPMCVRTPATRGRSRRVSSVAEAEQSKPTNLPWLLRTGRPRTLASGVAKTAGQTSRRKKEEKKDGEPQVLFSGQAPLLPVFNFHKSRNVAQKPEDEIRKHLHGYKTEFLIATVPDPIDSP